ncbi:MAG: porphobilinogen synthase [Candidatus Methanomethyliaceae archaeon]|nr:porphobilinogen synthase [Candidatus Methanomethyliaceae archaeon]MDW7971357.1 porphobilinogen synthase [Nitrososphaerota archaeon]
MGEFPIIRMRRLRRTSALRSMNFKARIHPSDLIYPIFIDENAKSPISINSMPNCYRLPLNYLINEVERTLNLGIKAILLFGIPSYKDDIGSSAYDKNGIIPRAIRIIKDNFSNEIVVITDVCLCEYTSHGHCGIIKNGDVDNDSTLEVLGKIAISHAEAGADIVAPSSMMDGQVKYIRRALDDEGFNDIGIMAYSAKFASCFYGPFREAVDSRPKFGDRKSYQMNYGNKDEALREIALDISEGADIIMIKPALAYLDIIALAKERFNVPLAAYNVSGEYSMIKAAAQMGWIDEKSAVIEILTAIKRAGADLIITYFAREAIEWLKEI